MFWPNMLLACMLPSGQGCCICSVDLVLAFQNMFRDKDSTQTTPHRNQTDRPPVYVLEFVEDNLWRLFLHMFWSFLKSTY